MIIDNAQVTGSLQVSNDANIAGSLRVTGSIIGNITGSSVSSSFATSASFALTASYSLTGTGFPFSGSAVITGSILVTNLTGSGVRYVVADANGLVTAQTASAAILQTQQKEDWEKKFYMYGSEIDCKLPSKLG